MLNFREHMPLKLDYKDVVANRLKTKTCSVPLGINLVKTNDSRRPSTDEEVLSDYESACQRLESYGSDRPRWSIVVRGW